MKLYEKSDGVDDEGDETGFVFESDDVELLKKIGKEKSREKGFPDAMWIANSHRSSWQELVFKDKILFAIRPSR